MGDPSLFHIDFGRLTEVLISIVVFSFFIERALSIVFESRRFIEVLEKDPDNPKKGVKEIITLLVSCTFCFYYDFDAVTILLQSNETMTYGGTILTGAIIAGGSKASLGLFKDVLGFMSDAEKERKKRKLNNQNSSFEAKNN